MQVKLDDNTNINVEKAENGEEFILTVDKRIRISFSSSELKFLNALIDSALKEDDVMSREALQSSLKDAVVKYRPSLQGILRNVKIEDIAYAVWYIDDKSVAELILSNISKRSAEDVQTLVKENIERRIRKERSEGNQDIDAVLKEHGRIASSCLLKKILEA
ncbi:MAG: hypothetical protein AB7E76_04660 [Deferribacterales bacterium]